MRRMWLSIIAATLVIVAFGGPVDARSRVRYAQTTVTNVTWEEDEDGDNVILVEGNISSTNSKCVPDRTIEVYAGPSESLQSLFGSGTTDAAGNFSVSGSVDVDSFYSVHVLKKRINRLICRTTANFGEF
jgi:hypothetical protein